ncbi:MAG TPA: DUF3592 domain-containing protein [Burkholderiales bacterium]|nr:DUF3592 domain-containing protein [Burkholderiales bacterium]
MSLAIPNQIGALLVAALSLFCLVCAASMYVQRRAFLKGAITTVGVVTEVQVRIETMTRFEAPDGTRTSSTTEESYESYTPVVRFYTAAGNAVVFTSDGGSATRDYKVGQQVPVVYAADSPEQAEIRSFASLWLAPLVLLAGSLFQALLALALFST